MKKKIVALVLVCVLVFGIAVGGTLAWLTTKTQTVINTFTVGDVNITLTESKGEAINSDVNNRKFDAVPGLEIAKDPVVTVAANSVDSWVFVKIVETNNTFDIDKKFLVYDIDSSDWTALDGETGVYYAEAPKSNTDTTFNVIKDTTVTFNGTATEANCEAAESAAPSLAITAYAVQKQGFTTPAAAWAEAEKLG